MEVYLQSNEITRYTRQGDFGTYLGTDDGWTDDMKNYPSWSGSEVVVDTAAKSAAEAAETTSLRASLKTAAQAHLATLVGTSTVTHSSKTYALSSYSDVHGLISADNAGLTPANGLHLTTTAGERVSLTSTVLKNIGQKMMDKIDDWKADLAVHIAAIDAANLGTLRTYDVTTGWTA